MKPKQVIYLAWLILLVAFSSFTFSPAAAQTPGPAMNYLPLLLKSCPGRCFFVSSSGGSDSNSGLDSAHPFKTLARISVLNLLPNDRMFLKCGDTWRGETLNIRSSGTSSAPILFSSYPEACVDQPRIDGTQPVTGWIRQPGTNIFYADLGVGANAARFRDLSGANTGINQVFRNGERLTMGRWPNIGEAGFDNGYSIVDSQPGNAFLADEALTVTGKNFTGGTIHLKVIRWSMINRDITEHSGALLGLNTRADCWDGCSGWGYFINNHLNTLDQDGEWYYDKSARRVYLYSTLDPVEDIIEASVIFGSTDRNLGLITLGEDLQSPVVGVVVDNLDLRGSWNNGIASPTNFHREENSYLTLRNNTIRDADSTGIDLWSWVYDASDGLDGWRGGNHIVIENNLITGANHFGIHTPSRETILTGNTISNIGMIASLNESGMGCGNTGSEGTCTECGTGLRIYTDNANRSGYGFTIQGNRFEYIGYNGIQTFGSRSVISGNVFDHTCYSKGDCGAVNTFGNNSMNSSNVYDIQILDNLILNTIGNVDGASPSFHSLFGFGIYLDNNSRNITTRGNTVAYSTATGILYQNATGTIQNNIVFQNGGSEGWYSQVAIIGSGWLSNFTGNVLVSHRSQLRGLSLERIDQLTVSDYNRFYHTTNANYQVSMNGTDYTLGQWRISTGKDPNSATGSTGFAASLKLFVNDSGSAQTINATVGTAFTDLDGNPIGSSFTLPAMSSRVVAVVAQ